jgi:hypothetical protein
VRRRAKKIATATMSVAARASGSRKPSPPSFEESALEVPDPV